MNENTINIQSNTITFCVDNQEYKIPSDLFPLNGPSVILYNDVTKALNNKKVKNIFNNTEYQLGRCYTNAEHLYQRLLKAKINPSQLKYIIGWLFIEPGFPIHHAFVLYNDKYVLDLTPIMNDTEYFQKFISESKLWNGYDDMRQSYIKWYKQFITQSNEKIGTFGKMRDSCFFIGCESTKEKGVEMWNYLMEKYPNHPSNNNADNNGITPLQSMIINNKT